MTPFWLLSLKLTLVPLLIWGISVAGRIWGPSVAGWLSAFPVVTGPILFFISVEHGEAFGASAASSTLMAILAHLSFGLGYAWAATRWRWPLALPCGLASYGVCLYGLSRLSWGFEARLLTVAAVLLVARRLFPAHVPRQAAMRAASSPMLEMSLRMVAGALLVLFVTWLAGDAGPRWSGLLAMFPVLGVVLAVFSHRQSGAGFTVDLLRNMVWGYFAFATFCVLIAACLARPGIGLGLGFAMAVAGALSVQGLTLVAIRRQGASGER